MAARCLVILLIGMLAGCGGDTSSRDLKQPPKAVYGVDSGGMVDVGGHRLFVQCTGSGSPTVILEAGLGGMSNVWGDVVPALGRTTRTCAYDRAGLGASEPIPGVHDAADEIEDLSRLLDRADIDPPYVLVGHSYGGPLVRLFAREHPADVRGMVLLDAMGFDSTRRELALWPKSVAPAARRAWAKPIVDGVDLREGEDLDRRGTRSFRDMPLVVISARHHPELPRRISRVVERLWAEIQGELAALSSDHAHVVALRSNHLVQQAGQQPLVVVGGVRAVVRAVRDDAPLPPCARLFTGRDVDCRS